MFVTAGPCDGSQTLLGNTHKVVLRLRGANGIHGHCQTSVGTVFETNGERETRCELTVQLRLGCSCANGAKRNEICEKLWRDCVEHLGGNGHALRGKIDVKLTRDAKALVDLVALIDVRIVDQTFPTDCCSWFLKVGTHDDAEVVLELVSKRLKALAVLHSHLGVMNGARPNHNQKTVILLCNDLRSFLAALDNCLFGVCWDGEFVGEERRRDQWVVTKDWDGQLACAL